MTNDQESTFVYRYTNKLEVLEYIGKHIDLFKTDKTIFNITIVKSNSVFADLLRAGVGYCGVFNAD